MYILVSFYSSSLQMAFQKAFSAGYPSLHPLIKALPF